ncbi:MAG: hypothetical protein JSW71_12105 [Gemmatimonadota bacterium]|nr:MAG: hypothetical protein JSW71_12105 [Gemmatimonadota bacterium]
MSAIALWVDPSGKTAVIRLRGQVVRNDVETAVGLLCRAEGYRRDATVIWDLEHAGIEMNPRQIIGLVRSLMHRPSARGGKHAVVVTRDLDYGLARLAEAYVEAWLETELMVFRNRGDAEEWLGKVRTAKLH